LLHGREVDCIERTQLCGHHGSSIGKDSIADADQIQAAERF